MASDGSVVGEDTLTSNRYWQSYCLTPGDYTLKVTFFSDSEYALVHPLVLMESGVILETFSKKDVDSSKERRIHVGDILPYGSTLKFLATASIADNWMNDGFDDKSWNEGKTGSWITTNNITTYFRKEVTIDNPRKYSQFFIEMTVVTKAVLYLNGKELRTFMPSSSEETKTLIYGDANQLATKNMIAVKVDGATPLTFDIRLHLMTSQCFSSAFTGKAYTNQPLTQPYNYPDNAFSEYGTWTAEQFPVNLEYSFDNDIYITPTSVSMGSYDQTERVPKEVRVFGRIVDHSNDDSVLVEEEIGYVNDPSFFNKVTTESIPLSPKRAYNSFRFVFIKASDSTVPISNILFYMCQQGTCKKEKKAPETSLGDVIYSRCSLGSYGYKQKICSRNDVVPTWEVDESMCLSKWPRSSSAFIDVDFLMTDPIRTTYESVLHSAKLKLKESLPLLDGQIAFPVNYQYTEDGTTYLRVILRLTVEEEAGDYVYKKLTDFYDEFVEYMKKETSYYYSSLTFSEEPKLYTPLEWGNVIVIVIVFAVGMIMGIICAYMYMRSKGALSNRKSLKKSDAASLLSQADVFCVCWNRICGRGHM